MAALFQLVFLFQLPKIVDLTVKDDHHAAIFIGHRLMPVIGQIDHRQAPKPQSHAIIRPDTIIIRPAMRQCLGHPGDQLFICRRCLWIKPQDPTNSAHVNCFPSKSRDKQPCHDAAFVFSRQTTTVPPFKDPQNCSTIV